MKQPKDLLNKKILLRSQPDSFAGLPKRPRVKKTRLVIDNEYFEKGYGAIFPNSTTVVYCVLARRANWETQTCYPSGDDIMRLGGIKNRQTVFDAIKLLEAFDLIYIKHSKGKVSNFYALLQPSAWKDSNSIKIETVLAHKKRTITVSKSEGQPLQKDIANSVAGDTRSNITKSDKEITAENKKISIKGVELLQRLSPTTKSVVTRCFREDDIIGALEELVASGSEVEKLGHKLVLETLLRRDAVPTKELPSWIT